MEASIVLYLLMRKNYEFTKMKSIALVHAQVTCDVQFIFMVNVWSTEDDDCLFRS